MGGTICAGCCRRNTLTPRASIIQHMIKPQPGTYALILASSRESHLQVGKLGILRLQPGFYVYIGSALGPGGLQARLAHHLETTARPHWHIDYLKAHANALEVWYCHDRIPWEHRWAHCLGMLPGASVALTGFGSSDCGCETHLYFFRSRPSMAAFARRLRVFDCPHTHLQFRRLKLDRRKGSRLLLA